MNALTRTALSLVLISSLLFILCADGQSVPARRGSTFFAAGHDEVPGTRDTNRDDNNGRTKTNSASLLHQAVTSKQLDLVRKLIVQGAKIDSTDELGRTPLHYAVRTGQIEIVIVLLDHHANPNVQNASGDSPLHIIGVRNRMEIALKLVAGGANVNVRNDLGWSPLHYASIAGDTDFAGFLIAHGAQVDAAAKDGSTALHVASAWGKTEVVALLLEKGAAINNTDRDNRTALQFAVSENYHAIENILRGRNASEDLYTAVASHNTASVRKLLTNNSAVACEACGAWRETALHLACRYGYSDLAEMILEKNKSCVDTQDKRGMTPLHMAAINGHQRTAEILLKNGARLNVEDGGGKTPLERAKENLHEPLVHLLSSIKQSK